MAGTVRPAPSRRHQSTRGSDRAGCDDHADERPAFRPESLAPARIEFDLRLSRPRGRIQGEEKEAEMTNPKRRGAAATTDDRSTLFRLAMIATAIGLLLAVAA
jgi:hypothetical protein